MKRSCFIVLSCLLLIALSGCTDSSGGTRTAGLEEKPAVSETGSANTAQNPQSQEEIAISEEDVTVSAEKAGTSPESEKPETITETGSTTDLEKTPFVLWEYEGYIDECREYTWQEEFMDCDYDGDGKTDRVSRSWDRDEQTAVYTVEFGNGDRLVVPKGWETGFPHIQGGDLDGDGENEILVTLSYDTSTDPYAFGEMWLFDRDVSTGEYAEADLPLAIGENGAKGFNIDYGKPENGRIRFTIKDAGLSMEEDVGEEYVSLWWTDEARSDMRNVYHAEISSAGNPVLRCYIAPFPRNLMSLGFNLNYRNGKYVVGYIETDSPREDGADNEASLSDSQEEETIPEYFVYVDASDGYANLRTGPGTEHNIICQIPNGEALEVYRSDATAANGKKWLKVAYWMETNDDAGSWVTGWIAESQLQE